MEQCHQRDRKSNGSQNLQNVQTVLKLKVAVSGGQNKQTNGYRGKWWKNKQAFIVVSG